MRTADLILKTYPTDYDWLPYLFRSLPRAKGWRKLVVILEEQYPEPPDLPANAVIARTRRYIGTDPNVPDKLLSTRGCVMERLAAFRYTDAEVLVYVDSDQVFIREIDLQTDAGVTIDKPCVWWRKWEEAGPGIGWLPSATATLGYPAKVCCMCHSPMVYPAEVLRRNWEFVGGYDRLKTLGDTFTDWDALGNFAIDHCQDLITPVYRYDPGTHGTPASVRQFWSWSRASNPDVQKAMREMGLA